MRFAASHSMSVDLGAPCGPSRSAVVPSEGGEPSTGVWIRCDSENGDAGVSAPRGATPLWLRYRTSPAPLAHAQRATNPLRDDLGSTQTRGLSHRARRATIALCTYLSSMPENSLPFYFSRRSVAAARAYLRRDRPSSLARPSGFTLDVNARACGAGLAHVPISPEILRHGRRCMRSAFAVAVSLVLGCAHVVEQGEGFLCARATDRCH